MTHRVGPRSRGRRRIRGGRLRRTVPVTVVCVVALTVAWSWFAVKEIYFPRTDPLPGDVDVIVQLGGIPPGDYQAARDLAQQRGVPDLVLSNPVGQVIEDRYCGGLPGVRVHCFAPDPSTTRGEARAFASLAEQNNWRSAYVLATGREHVERVRFYFSRCWDGELAVNRPASGRSVRTHLGQSWYQTAGWVKAVRAASC